MTNTLSLKKTAIVLTAFGALVTGMAVTPASAAGYMVNDWAKTTNFAPWDTLNIRAWPAAHSQKLAHVRHGKWVKVERCIIKAGSDWCKIRKGWKQGWVNGRYLVKGGQSFGDIHHIAYGWH